MHFSSTITSCRIGFRKSKLSSRWKEVKDSIYNLCNMINVLFIKTTKYWHFGPKFHNALQLHNLILWISNQEVHVIRKK